MSTPSTAGGASIPRCVEPRVHDLRVRSCSGEVPSKTPSLMPTFSISLATAFTSDNGQMITGHLKKGRQQQGFIQVPLASSNGSFERTASPAHLLEDHRLGKIVLHCLGQPGQHRLRYSFERISLSRSLDGVRERIARMIALFRRALRTRKCRHHIMCAG